MAEGDTLVNALIGAVATIVLSGALPFAPVVGGLLAGYLEGGSRNSGLRVGLVSGGIALIPAVFIAFIISNFLFFSVSGLGVPGAAGGLGFVFIIFGLLFATAYIVGLSAVGGWLGNYVKHDTDIGA